MPRLRTGMKNLGELLMITVGLKFNATMLMLEYKRVLAHRKSCQILVRVRLKTSPPKVICEDRVALAQVRNKVPIGYNGTPHINPKNCSLPFDDHHPI